MTSTLTPAQRALYGSIGAARRWGHTPDRTAATAPARAALASKWEREVRADFPEATDEQVAAMAEQRRKEFYRKLTAKSIESRRAKAARR